MKRILPLLALLLCLTACSEIQLASHLTKRAMPTSKSEGTFKVGTPYKIDGKRYYPTESYDLVETGIASWYGPNFHGKSTANGEKFDMNELTAAHRTLQMPSLVRVTNLENGRSLIVRVNDRGPYSKGRVIDVSKRAAELLGFKNQGTAKVKLQVLKEESLQIAQAAKSGENTRGYELALNRSGKMPTPPASPTRVTVSEPAGYQTASATPVAGGTASLPQPVTREALMTTPQPDMAVSRAIPGKVKNGAFYPDPIVTEVPVTPSNIYVQAGSFSVADNANRLKSKLEHYARADVYPAIVNGKQFYRVRLGPIESVAHADAVLAQLSADGTKDAIIIVD